MASESGRGPMLTGTGPVGLRPPGLEWSTGERGAPSRSRLDQGHLPEAAHALRVRPVQRQAGEELRRHAAAAAGVVGRAGRTGPAGLRLAQVREQVRGAPHRGEAARVEHVAGQELGVDRERAGVDVTDRVDQADHAAGAAQVQPRQRRAVAGQVEERVAGQDVVAAVEQPVVERALLVLQQVHLVPDVRAATGGPQPGQPQGRAVALGQRRELVELRRHSDGSSPRRSWRWRSPRSRGCPAPAARWRRSRRRGPRR